MFFRNIFLLCFGELFIYYFFKLALPTVCLICFSAASHVSGDCQIDNVIARSYRDNQFPALAMDGDVNTCALHGYNKFPWFRIQFSQPCMPQIVTAIVKTTFCKISIPAVIRVS